MILASRLAPITRKENFLARAAGNDGLELDPITREERFLQDIIDSSGSGGSKTPVVVDFTLTGMNTGTWSGATWNDLVKAFYDGRAFLRYQQDFMRITGYDILADNTLNSLIAEGSNSVGTYIWVSLRSNNNATFKLYSLSS